MTPHPVPELLSPAGSLDAVRAAVANGANAVYLGASRFNARDEGAQLSMEDLELACQIAHGRGVRVYLTFNVLVKPRELADALLYLGECIDAGIDAAIVQDLGLIRLIQRVYPDLEIHGSTQMTVHDVSGAAVAHDLGIERIVLARENTIADIRAIRAAVPDIGLETFVHGALCISYSGQCYMSGMISERSANRGSCAQSCRKDYELTDAATGTALDGGYLISAKDLAAHDHLADIADAGVGCLKIEGRKKKPEYVASVTRSYRDWLERVARGERAAPPSEEVEPLVQIFSRGFTGGMYGGRVGRDYITRTQPDNRGAVLGTVVGFERGEVFVEVSRAVAPGDGLGFEPPAGLTHREAMGFAASHVRTVAQRDGTFTQAIAARTRVPVGWRVVRSSDGQLLERARASYAALPTPARGRKARLDVRVFGAAGTPLKAIVLADGEAIEVRSEATLAPAARRALDRAQLRDQLGRLGDTPFVLAAVDDAALAEGMFLPVSELNRLRQRAVDELLLRRDWTRLALVAERQARVEAAVGVAEPRGRGADITRLAAAVPVPTIAVARAEPAAAFGLSAVVFTPDDARAAARAGATEVTFDPFLRHPAPPVSRVRALAEELAAAGVAFRLRLPTIVRPDERRQLDRWLALDVPVLAGHLGLVAELAASGRDVVADYAVNCFNQHTAAELFALGARRSVLSIELTVDELAAVAAPWRGEGFEVFLYGRPEGMTIEHCVLSAAFERVATTCRDLCVQKHTNVTLTDPAGYTFAVATDSAWRNRLLHSRPIDGSEFVPKLWQAGLRRYQLAFNVPDEPVERIVGGYRALLEGVASGEARPAMQVRELLAGAFTRGHFARAV